MNGFLKFIIIIFILISATILPLSLWLKTDDAQERIELFIEETLTEQLGVNAKISGVSFSFPLIAKIKNISFSEQAKETIIIKDFYINILPSLFSFWEVTIWSLSAEELHILKLPTIKTKDSNKNSTGFFNPNILIKEADIARIILSKSLTNQEDDLIISLDSHLEYYSNKQDLHFAMINQLLAPDSYMLGDNSLEILGSYNIKKDTIKINSLKIQSDLAEASGNFSMDKSTNTISGDLQYKTNILESILSKNFENTTSTLSGIVKISGTASTPQIHTSGNVSIDLPQNDYFKFYPLSWDVNLTLSDNSADGTISLLQNDVTATGKLGYKNNKLYLKKLKATAPNFEKLANLTFDTDSSILTGTISVNDTNLQTSAKILPFLRSGALSLAMNYSSPDNKTQQVSATGQIKQLYTKFGNCALIDIDLKINDLWNFKLAPSKLALTSLDIDDIKLSHIALNAFSNNNDIQLNGSILANQPYPINLNFSSVLSSSPPNFNININNLSGILGSVAIKNSTDILFKYGKETSLELHNFNIGEGVLNITTELKEPNIKANATLQNIPMRILPSFLPNSFKHALIGGVVNLSGSITKPILESTIDINNITLANTANPLSFKIITNITNDNTNISGNILEDEQEIAKLSAIIASKFSLSPFEYTIDKQNFFTANITTIKNFDLLSMLPIPPGNELSGNIQGSLTASGSVNSPKLSGDLKITNGEYNYKQYGILLKDITAIISANGQKISFNKIKANDRFNNPLTASGTASLDQSKNFTLTATTDKFNLMNTPYLQGEVKGKLTINGDKDSATSKGHFILGPLEIKIPEHFQQNIPELHISEVIQANDEIVYTNDTPYELKLDIALQTAEKVYVRGWGVDTQLKGDLHVTGYASAPLINGTLNSVRGKYQEFGKSLKVKEGVLTFDGPISPSPYLNIVGVSNVGSNEIRLILSGSIQTPDITIESTPSMTQEEALSMLLFGENPENISTFQALQLADGARRLSGHGGGFDPLGLGRKILGVDDISFKSDSENPENTSIGVGKHLSDKIYFEIEKGRQEGSTKTKIEVQITPKISIENVTKQEGNTSLGVNWRFDY